MKNQPLERDSTESQKEETSFWFAFKRFICPCLVPKQKNSPLRDKNRSFQPIDGIELSNLDAASTADKKFNNTKSIGNFSAKDRRSKRSSQAVIQLETKRETLLNKDQQMNEFSENLDNQTVISRRSTGNRGWNYPVYGLSEKQIISVGVNDRHILLKVSSIHLSPNPTALKKQLSQSKIHRRQVTGNSAIDKYWVQRYALFQRFDEGIKLDEESWSRTPPGPVCQWIAQKCRSAKLVVDAFAGVGGVSIRIANGPMCMKVISNDWNRSRLQCLINNSKVYEVDRCIELSQNNFLKFSMKGVQVVFIHPPLGDLQTQKFTILSIVDFEPTLDKIISKALSLANNFILLLPAATSIDVLCSCINKCATELNKMKDSCSAKLQKIYWQGELKYILLSVGRLVQEQIKLSHQLNFIYERLQEPEKGYFKQKKIVKALREEYGMIFLLNLTKESEKRFRQKKNKEGFKVMDELIQLIRQRSLISQQKFNRLLSEQESPLKRESNLTIAIQHNENYLETPFQSVMEEEKMNQDIPNIRHSQITQSEESHYSYLSNLSKPLAASREPRIFPDSFGSIIIKRTLKGSQQKRSVSPNSPGITNTNPLSPSRKQKNRVSPINRTSQGVPKKKKFQKLSKDY